MLLLLLLLYHILLEVLLPLGQAFAFFLDHSAKLVETFDVRLG